LTKNKFYEKIHHRNILSKLSIIIIRHLQFGLDINVATKKTGKMKDLTNSNIPRQNIPNNKYALQRIQEYIGLEGILFEGEYRFTKEMLVDFFGIDISTLNRYLSNYEDELKHNGYILSKGKQMKAFKLQFGHLINKTTKTTALGLFDFQFQLKGLIFASKGK
jgi:hypothetical protein